MTETDFAGRAEEAKGRLYRTALLYLGSESMAIDAVDEAVFKGFRACKKLREESFFDTWLTRILINVCKDELRHRKREVDWESVPEEGAETLDSLPLKEAILRLAPELKEVVILRYFTGLTLEETAKSLGIPRGTVATRQRKALSLLRLELDEEVET